MADYAGAVAAIIQKMIDEWKTGGEPTTPIVFRNKENEYDPSTNTQQPWVYFDVIGNGSSLRGVGSPGDHIWIYNGLIAAHVYVPVNNGTEIAQAHAVAIGEIFRAKGFYNDGQGRIVRTGSPRTDGGEEGSEDGNWYVVTCRIPFEYLHRG